MGTGEWVPAPEEKVAEPRAGGRPRICVSGRQLRELSNEMLVALRAANAPPELFFRGGAMVDVVQDEKGRHVIRQVDVDGLCARLTVAADFYKKNKSGGEFGCPPAVVGAKNLLKLAPYEVGFPGLDVVTEVPILRPDGSLLDKRGYDGPTKLYFSPDPGLKMPPLCERPSSDHIEAARDLIELAIGDFPYDCEASRANAYAALLTPIIRPLINSPVPLGLFDAPQAGTGKSLECDLIAIVATGQPGKMYSAPKDPDEWRKVITATLNSGTSVIIFDNVTKPLDNGDLCSVLTASIWADRRMGTHEEMTFPVKSSFFATGNNVRLLGDMPRRCYRIRLDAKCSRPFVRTGFRIENLKAWATEHRGELLAALLTLARAWHVAGRPKSNVKPLGSFEAWTVTIGGILQHAGVRGFLENSEQMYAESDDEATQLEIFLLALHEIFYAEPFSVAQIADALRERSYVGTDGRSWEPAPRAERIRAVLPEFVAEAMDRDGFFRRRLGRVFSSIVDRRFGDSGVYLKRGGVLHGNQCWEVAGVELPRNELGGLGGLVGGLEKQ